MRRLALPLALAFVASLFLAPAAAAQDESALLEAQDTPQEDVSEEFLEEILENPTEPPQEQLQEAQQEAALEQQAGVPEPAEVEDQQQTPQGGQQKAAGGQQKAGGGQQKQMPKQQPKETPKTGGVQPSALLLPAGALLVGTGILAAYGVRRYKR